MSFYFQKGRKFGSKRLNGCELLHNLNLLTDGLHKPTGTFMKNYLRNAFHFDTLNWPTENKNLPKLNTTPYIECSLPINIGIFIP